MYINKEIRLIDIKTDLIFIKQDTINVLNTLMKFLVQTFIDLFNNYKDYAPSNIRAKGLVNILMDRAIRFFGMTEVVEESTDKHPKFKNQKASRSVKSISHKYFIRFVFRIIIFPVYLGFLMVYRIFKKKRTKGLQNCYKT